MDLVQLPEGGSLLCDADIFQHIFILKLTFPLLMSCFTRNKLITNSMQLCHQHTSFYNTKKYNEAAVLARVIIFQKHFIINSSLPRLPSLVEGAERIYNDDEINRYYVRIFCILFLRPTFSIQNLRNILCVCMFP